MDQQRSSSAPREIPMWGGFKSLATAGIAVIAFGALLHLAWISAATLFLVFAGVLFGAFLDGLTRAAGRVLPLPRWVRLTLVCLLLAGAVGGLAAFGGVTVAQQGRDLSKTVRQQSEIVRDWLDARGVNVAFLDAMGPSPNKEEGKDENKERSTGQGAQTEASPKPEDGESDKRNESDPPGQAPGTGSGLPKAGDLLSPAVSVVMGLFNALGNALVILFLGVAVAVDPSSYRNGVVRFVPPRHRHRGESVLDGMGKTLRHWLFGQLLTMAVIFACTWVGLAFLGVGGALILGLQAGLLAFVPTIGPLVAGVVILLASLASGSGAVLGALGVYLAVQALESYLLTPLIQKEALDIPPATIFAGQLILGALFGLWGIALALPLMAVIKVLLDQLYVEETLGEPAES